ncbi:hypothetical protein D3C77_620890 [compost metagenome]
MRRHETRAGQGGLTLQGLLSELPGLQIRSRKRDRGLTDSIRYRLSSAGTDLDNGTVYSTLISHLQHQLR